MAPPSWIQDAIFYQIFPDRFANGDPSNDPPDAQPGGAPPTIHGFQGGDLKGIVDRLDYLTDLGVYAVYLNPIFRTGSNHRSNTSDYLRLDDRLADGHVARGDVLLFFEWDWTGAESEYRRALGTEPHDEHALQSLAWLLSKAARFDEAKC